MYEISVAVGRGRTTHGCRRRAANVYRLPVLALLATACLLLISLPAWAGSRVSVLKFQGKKATALRYRVIREVKEAGHEVARVKALPRDSSESRFTSFSERRKIDAYISAVSSRDADGWNIEITVHGPDGTPEGEPLSYSAESMSGLVRELKTTGRDDFRDALEPPLGGASAAYEPKDSAPADSSGSASALGGSTSSDDDDWGSEDGDSDSTSEEGSRSFLDSPALVSDDELADSGSDGESSGDLLRLAVSGGVVRRDLSYVDDLYGRMRTSNTTGWLFRIDANLLPFAPPLADRVVLFASYEGALFGEVADGATGLAFGVNHSEFQGGVRLRQPFGEHAIALDLAFGQLSSGLEDPEARSRVPEFSYTMFRAALSASVQWGELALSASGGLRLPTSYGEVSETPWFPRIDGSGVEAGVGASYPIASSVTLVGSGTLRRFVLEMNSEPDDALQGINEVAGGAVDLYLSGYLGVQVAL